MRAPARRAAAARRLAELTRELANSPVERLKWQVLRAFGALPTERRARKMTDRDYLWCALNLLLDASEPETEAAAAGENASFDEERYQRLSRGEQI